jgi:hypothetical protein
MPALADVIAVVDAGDSQIELRLKTDLSVVLAVGSAGAGDAQLNAPTHIALDENFVHIQDTGNVRASRWNWADLSYFDKVTWADLGLAWSVNCLAINKVQMLLGRVGTSLDTKAFRFMSPYTTGSTYAGSAAGVIVGMAIDNDYLYLADSSGNKVWQYPLGGGAGVAYTTVPAGYTVAGLAMDDTQLYVPCNHATNDTKVLILNKVTLADVTSGDLTGKKVCYAMTVDDTKLFWTDTGDHSINWILKDLTGAITSAVDLTAPAGVAVLSPMYDDLYDTATVLNGGAVSGGASSGSASVYPTLPSGAAVSGGAAAGSFDPSLPAGAAVSGGAASGTLVVNPSLPVGAAVSGGAAAGSFDPSLSPGASVGGGVAAGSFESSGPADRMVVSSDENDSVAVLTDVTRE